MIGKVFTRINTPMITAAMKLVLAVVKLVESCRLLFAGCHQLMIRGHDNMPRGGKRENAGRKKVYTGFEIRKFSIKAHESAWKMLETMRKNKSEAKGEEVSMSALLETIICNYVGGLEPCPVCKADDDKRIGCTGCGGEGYLEQLAFK